MPRVTVATNEPAPTRLAVLAVIVLASAALLIALMLWLLSGQRLPLPATGLLGIALMLWGLKWVLRRLNGSDVALTEIEESEETERRRITAQEAAIEQHYTLLSEQETHRHDEEMHRIDADSQLQEHAFRLTALEDALTRHQLPAPVESPSYVANHVRPEREAVQQFVAALYDKSTSLPDPAKVHPSGALKIPLPWRSRGGEWGAQGWGRGAATLCLESQRGLDPLFLPIEHNGSTRGYRFNIEEYPDKASFLRWLAAVQ